MVREKMNEQECSGTDLEMLCMRINAPTSIMLLQYRVQHSIFEKPENGHLT